MSDIGRLEAELSRQQAINRELSSELSAISYGVQNAYSRLEQFNSKICNALDTSSQFLSDSENKMESALQVQAEIEDLYVRFKAMELANKRIRDCNNRKFYDFANYTKVRKLVQGIMDNLDVQMASDRVIYKSVERQHLQTPDYWLTCALLSIMGWKNDDKALADRAMHLAMELDLKSSSVFYILFNLRMNREEAALKWFYQYQTCDLKGADQRTFLLLFALVSKSVNASEDLSPRYKSEIVQFIHKVVDATIQSQGYSRDEMIQGILDHLEEMTPTEQMDYPLLRKHCGDYRKLNSILMHAKSNITIRNFLTEVLHVAPEQRNLFIKNFIDELIAAPNAQEKALEEEIAYNETVIRYEGDVSTAADVFWKQKAHNEQELNLIYEMIEWIYGADADDVNAQSRMNMFVLTADLQKEAIKDRIQAYRSCDRTHLQMKIDDYSTTMDLRDKAGEEKKLTDFYAAKRDNILQGIKTLPAILGFAAGGAAFVASFFVSYYLMILTALGVGYGAVKLILNNTTRKQAELSYEENCRLGSKLLGSLFGEFAQYEAEFRSYDLYDTEIQAELDRI